MGERDASWHHLPTVLKGLGVARDPDSPLGQVMTLVSHPVHLARTFAREVIRQRRGERHYATSATRSA